MMKKITVLIVCLCVAGGAMAQASYEAVLNQRLQGKTKFYDIKNTVEAYFDEQLSRLAPGDSLTRKGLGKQAKRWNRYFYESESRLNASGEIENAAAKIVDYLSTGEAAQFTQSSSGSWSHVGPTNVSSGIGRINRIAFDHTNPNMAYAGSAAGGMYKTTNNGSSWQNLGSFIPSLGVSGIVVSHNNAQIVYALTGDGDGYAGNGFNRKFGYIRYSVGVLKSNDGGQSWYRTAAFPGLENSRYVGYQLAQDPNDAATLIAATSRGLFKTTNGGISWTGCQTTNGYDVMVYDIKYKPGSSSIVYCTYRTDGSETNSCSFARSDNGGTYFLTSGITYSNAIDNASRITIGVTPANANYVYLLCGPGYVTPESDANDTFKGLYRSTNSGLNFTRRSNSPDILAYQDVINQFGNQSLYDLALAVSPSNANLIVAGGLVVWSSTNGGTDWSEIVDYFQDIDNSNYIHPDVHQLAFNPLSGTLYACTDGGVSLSSDNGTYWSRRFNGLDCTQFYHFEPSNEDGNAWGGAQDNGILIKEDNSSAFSHFEGGDGYDVLTDKAPAGNNNDQYWVTNQYIYADGAADINITPSDITSSSANFFPSLAMSPTNEDVLYAGYRDLRVSYSRGDNWAKIAIPGPGTLYVPGNWCVATCRTNRKRVYSAGKSSSDQGLYRVDNLDDVVPDAVTNLSTALMAVGYPNTDTKITDIVVSTKTSARLWLTVGGFTDGAKVFYSNDAGASFTNISKSLPNLPANAIEVDADDNVYVGTDIGVYYKGVNDADWTPFYNGLPRVPVSELKLAGTISGNVNLFASTYGRGIWVSDIFSNCPTTQVINQNLTGPKFYQAGGITSTASVQGGAGTNVFFRAATSVTLFPDFIVTPASEFVAYIGPCNTGPVPLRTATIDSIINVITDIAMARKYGFVHDAVADALSVRGSFNIFTPAAYTVRIYDDAAGSYVAEIPVNFMKGTNTVNIPLEKNWGKYLRMDLFSGNTLVHYHDFEKR